MTGIGMIMAVFLVTANPGEDAGREVQIRWQSYTLGSQLLLTKADDTPSTASTGSATSSGQVVFKEAKTCVPEEEEWRLSGGDSLAGLSRYVCSVELKGLEPGTSYAYRIIDRTGRVMECETRMFRTAPDSGDVVFIALADLQHDYNTATHPLVERLKAIAPEASLAVCSGDITGTGSYEGEWRYMMDHAVWHNMLFAASPGDHAYWLPKDGKHYPQMPGPMLFAKLFDFPRNGIEERVGSNYWFVYHNILFIALDMCDSNTSESDVLVREAAWMKEVVEARRGTYRWLVVYEHKSIYGSPITDSGVVKHIQPLFAPVFRELGVDLVISGHDHKYSRTRLIDGTYYLDLGSSGNKFRSPEEALYTDGIHDKVMDLKEDSTCVGAIVRVSDTALRVEVRDSQGQVLDAFAK